MSQIIKPLKLINQLISDIKKNKKCDKNWLIELFVSH